MFSILVAATKTQNNTAAGKPPEGLANEATKWSQTTDFLLWLLLSYKEKLIPFASTEHLTFEKKTPSRSMFRGMLRTTLYCKERNWNSEPHVLLRFEGAFEI